MWWKIVAVTVIVLILVIIGLIIYGRKSWQAQTKALQTSIEAAQLPPTSETYNANSTENLPAPVQRYFAAVLKDGQPLIRAATVEHTGTFNMSETDEQWTPFESVQRIQTRQPGFVWDARIRMLPALKVFVLDAYAAGRGVLTAKILGLVTVMDQPQTPELAQGELMRFLAEAVWYPTVLAPGQGVVWEAIDDSQTRATLTDGKTTASLIFHFDERGLIKTVRSEGRYREVNGRQVATPWQGRFWDYEWRDGMLVPLSGEVGWLTEEGLHLYWRGHIEQIDYKYVQ